MSLVDTQQSTTTYSSSPPWPQSRSSPGSAPHLPFAGLSRSNSSAHLRQACLPQSAQTPREIGPSSPTGWQAGSSEILNFDKNSHSQGISIVLVLRRTWPAIPTVIARIQSLHLEIMSQLSLRTPGHYSPPPSTFPCHPA